LCIQADCVGIFGAESRGAVSPLANIFADCCVKSFEIVNNHVAWSAQ
jgi:hypothetical protein